MTLGNQPPQQTFQPQNNSFQDTGNFATDTGSFGGSAFAPSDDIFSTSQQQNFTSQPTQSFMQSMNAPIPPTVLSKPSEEGFGVFQTHEKDAWSMGQGIGRRHFYFWQ